MYGSFFNVRFRLSVSSSSESSSIKLTSAINRFPSFEPVTIGSTLFPVSKLLGHTSFKTTEKYYVDLLDENYSSCVNQLENILPHFSIKKSA